MCMQYTRSRTLNLPHESCLSCAYYPATFGPKVHGSDRFFAFKQYPVPIYKESYWGSPISFPPCPPNKGKRNNTQDREKNILFVLPGFLHLGAGPNSARPPSPSPTSIAGASEVASSRRALTPRARLWRYSCPTGVPLAGVPWMTSRRSAWPAL